MIMMEIEQIIPFNPVQFQVNTSLIYTELLVEFVVRAGASSTIFYIVINEKKFKRNILFV